MKSRSLAALVPVNQPVERNCYGCGRDFLSYRVNGRQQHICEACRLPADYRSKMLRLSRVGHLTPREKQVAALVAKGLQNKEIAWELRITEEGAKLAVFRLIFKTRKRNRTELAIWWHCQQCPLRKAEAQPEGPEAA